MSRDWTPEELQAASAAMIAAGHMSYEEFCAELARQTFRAEDYTIEYCPWCENEVVIHSKGITACPECGKPLAPCSVCEECISPCPYGCSGGASDEHKAVTTPPITQAEIEFAMKYL